MCDHLHYEYVWEYTKAYGVVSAKVSCSCGKMIFGIINDIVVFCNYVTKDTREFIMNGMRKKIPTLMERNDYSEIYENGGFG